MNSMTRRLVIGFGGAFFILSLLSMAVLYGLLSSHLHTQRALILKDRLDAVATLLKSPAHGLAELDERIEREWPDRGGERVYIDVRDSQDQVVSRTPRTPPKLLEAFANESAPSPIPHDIGVNSADGPRLHFLVRTENFENAVGISGPVVVHAAVGAAESEELLIVLREILLGVLVITVAVSLLVGVALVRKEMRPLDRIAEQVARIDSENLSDRIHIERLPRELSTLTDAFNHTLDRLSESFDRLSRFSSDLAHELRTPLTNMMGSLEVALGRERSEESYKEILSSNLEECARLQAIVDSLLFLARAQNQKRPLKREPLNVRQAVQEIVEFYEPLASDREIELSHQAPEAELLAEPVLFQRAIGNLLANAIHYTPQNGRIDLDVEKSGAEVRIRVRDNGIGIGAEHLDKIFDRFYRVDASRTIASGGTGLGLSIVKSIMDLHGGRVQVESQLGRGSSFVLIF